MRRLIPNVLAQYTWVRYADRETTYPLTITQDKYKYTDTLSYRFEADYSLQKRSRLLVFGVGSGLVRPIHLNSELALDMVEPCKWREKSKESP